MQSIVVYRSESERLADQFWMNFLSEHPVFCDCDSRILEIAKVVKSC